MGWRQVGAYSRTAGPCGLKSCPGPMRYVSKALKVLLLCRAVLPASATRFGALERRLAS